VSGSLPAVLYVRGCARSGTTLLVNILNRHPQIAIISEQPLGDVAERLLPIFWYEDFLEREQLALSAQRAAPRPTGMAIYEPVDSLEAARATHFYPTRARLGAMLAGIVEASLDKKNVVLIGSKTPGHWSSGQSALVASAFPTVKYVFVVRNPLDTINSMMNRRNKAVAGLDPSWPDKPVVDAISRYHEGVALLLSCTARDPNGFVVGYEELVTQPRRVLAALGEYLGVDMADDNGSICAARRATNVFTLDEERAVRDAFGNAIDAWSEKRLTGPIGQLGHALDDCVKVLEPRRTYRCDAPVGDRSMLGTGWSGSEYNGVCGDAAQSDLVFTVPRDGAYRLMLDVEEERHWPRRHRQVLTLEALKAGRPHREVLETRGGLRLRRLRLESTPPS
jgi:sulfotransferase family protein